MNRARSAPPRSGALRVVSAMVHGKDNDNVMFATHRAMAGLEEGAEREGAGNACQTTASKNDSATR